MAASDRLWQLTSSTGGTPCKQRHKGVKNAEFFVLGVVFFGRGFVILKMAAVSLLLIFFAYFPILCLSEQTQFLNHFVFCVDVLCIYLFFVMHNIIYRGTLFHCVVLLWYVSVVI